MGLNIRLISLFLCNRVGRGKKVEQHLPHLEPKRYPRMGLETRAELNSVLDEQQCHELDRKVNELLEQLEEHPMVQFTLFEEDRRKSRGNYREVKGIVIWFDD